MAETAKDESPTFKPPSMSLTPTGIAGTCVIVCIGGRVLWRNRKLSQLLRRGDLAMDPKYRACLQNNTLHKDLIYPVPDAPMVVLLGSRQMGKTFAMSHEAYRRRNTVLVGLQQEFSGDSKGQWTDEKVLCYVYDKISPKVGLQMVGSIIPAWIDFPDSFKIWYMLRILRNATVKTTLPTLAVDVHGYSDVDAKRFMEAFKVLNGTYGIRVMLAATEGSHFASTKDKRWDIIELPEVARDVAVGYLRDHPQKELLLDAMPLTAGSLTTDK
eukprot:PhM_4_TR2049/c3_g4_i1/m.95547